MELMLAIILAVLVAVCWAKLANRLGYGGFIGVLMLIPVVNVITFLILALSESPNEKKLRELTTKLWRLEPREEVEEIDLTKCPACGASVTEGDTRCPSCKLSFEL